ncbi:hypothetical protein J5N97_026328 [Dioscorea zingiberensis]|uniref:AP2/ERF domain-containing protein n=1 Tax=Dioscorea zingiberensis TaxID=325984 RepID=A0A9D5H6P1_9LILI|nr:hypothetical protein J5N97_026328 [Dioscorea zingiberensis]
MSEEGKESLESCARVFVSLCSDRRRRCDHAAAAAATAGAGEEEPAGAEVPELAVPWGHVLPSQWWESHIWAYDRDCIKFKGIDADINFNLSDYDEDLKQVVSRGFDTAHAAARLHSCFGFTCF